MSTLSDRAMLVNLSIKQWSASKHDRKVSKEVSDNHGSEESMGRFSKRLVAKEALEEIKRLAGAARQEHYKRTLPWSDDGSRILSQIGYFEYTEAMRQFETDYDRAVRSFLDDYSTHVDDARRRLNGLFDASEYPEEAEMRRKFAFGVNVVPLPTAGDFRVELGDVETDRIRERIEQQTADALNAAMADVYDRIKGVVGAMAERLRAYAPKPDGKNEGIFRDSLVENVRELVEILPSLNVTNNAQVAEFTRLMREKLCRFEAVELRVSESKRDATATAAEEILKSMEDFI